MIGWIIGIIIVLIIIILIIRRINQLDDNYEYFNDDRSKIRKLLGVCCLHR